MKPEEHPNVRPVEHTTDDPDEVASRPIGTRSFVFGALAVTRRVLPAMRQARRGRVIGISSVGGRVAF